MAPETAPARLDGWKQIASYLKKSERTATRWEQDFGLPVRRIGSGGNETVFAYRSEIDAWLRDKPPCSRHRSENESIAQTELPKPADAAKSRSLQILLPATILSVGFTLIVALFGTLAWSMVLTRTRDSASTPAAVPIKNGLSPTGWRVANNVFYALGSDSHELWRHAFGFAVRDDLYTEPVETPDMKPVLLEDLDGDGRPEVIVRMLVGDSNNRLLHVFGNDGRLLLTHSVESDAVYAEKHASPPFGINRMIVASGVDGPRIVFSAIHHRWFPSVVRVLTLQGDVLNEYWNNGHITALAAGELGSQHVIAVGGHNNETGFASLAILDPAVPRSIAPAESSKFLCLSCEGGATRHFVLFPPSRLARRFGTRPSVTRVGIEPRGRLTVGVTEYRERLPGDTLESREEVFYELDDRLRVVSVKFGSDYERIHARARTLGLATGGEEAANRVALRAVKIWNGGRFVLAEHSRP